MEFSVNQFSDFGVIFSCKFYSNTHCHLSHALYSVARKVKVFLYVFLIAFHPFTIWHIVNCVNMAWCNVLSHTSSIFISTKMQPFLSLFQEDLLLQVPARTCGVLSSSKNWSWPNMSDGRASNKCMSLKRLCVQLMIFWRLIIVNAISKIDYH